MRKKYDSLVEMRLADEISRKIYLEKRAEYEKNLEKLQEKIDELQNIGDVSEDDLKNKLNVLKYALENNFEFDLHDIPDSVIDAFVDKIIVFKDHFEWYLKTNTEEPIKCMAGGTKAKPNISVIEQTPPFDESDAGCYCRNVGLSSQTLILQDFTTSQSPILRGLFSF